MNKSRQKLLKQLSQVLGNTQTVIRHTDTVIQYAPDDLIKDEETGLPTPSKNVIKQTKNKVVNINHYRKMKRAYKKGGAQGVVDYMAWLKIHRAAMIIKYGTVDDKTHIKIDNWIDRVITGGPKLLWVNLTAMLAFILTFLKPSNEEE